MFAKGTLKWDDSDRKLARSFSYPQETIMGFADMSIAEIAEDFNVGVEEVLALCNQLGIAYKHPQTRLALEDAKAIMSKLMAKGADTGEDQNL